MYLVKERADRCNQQSTRNATSPLPQWHNCFCSRAKSQKRSPTSREQQNCPGQKARLSTRYHTPKPRARNSRSLLPPLALALQLTATRSKKNIPNSPTISAPWVGSADQCHDKALATSLLPRRTRGPLLSLNFPSAVFTLPYSTFSNFVIDLFLARRFAHTSAPRIERSAPFFGNRDGSGNVH